MSNITRKKLAKGTKIPAQSLDNFFDEVVDQVNTPEINNDNLPYKSNFDLTFNTRILKNNNETGWTVFGDMNVGTGTITKHAGDMGSPRLNTVSDLEEYIYQHFHFILPNPQEVFNRSGLTNESFVYSLNRIVVSVDTLDNPAGTYPSIEIDTPQGTYHSLAATDAMDITVSLHRKTPYANSQTTFWEEKVGEWTIPGTAFLNAGLDTNPLAFEDLKLKIFPDAIYLLSITSNNTEETLQVTFEEPLTNPQVFIINNLQINLGFSCELIPYDTVVETTGVPSIQNAPYSDQVAPWILSNTVPASTAILPTNEITEARIQGNISNIDKPIVRKLLGGYETDSSMPHHQQIQNSSCYEVKQVPILNNNMMLYNWVKKKQDAADPWSLFATRPGFTGTACNIFAYNQLIPQIIDWTAYQEEQLYYQIADRKFIPIHEPFTLHHMFFTYWVGDPTYADGERPEDPDTFFEVSVFLHTLNRSDSVIRQQIAYAKWQPVTGTDLVTGQNLLVDQSLWLEQQNSSVYRITSAIQPCGFTIQIPVNYGAAAAERGVGYTTTGNPLFMGRGYFPYSAYGSRTNMFIGINDSTQVQYTEGHESMIEVVFKMGNPDGIGSNIFTTSGEPEPAEDNYETTWAETGTKLQQPGAMLYMVGKKSLVDSRGNH